MIVLAILIIVAAIAAVVMSLAAMALIAFILFWPQIERALTPEFCRGYDDGGG